MDQSVKQMWVDALRSGEYEQSKGQLKGMDGKYCCLGVLCDLHHKTCGGSGFISGPATQVMWYEGEGAYLPQSVARWSSLPTDKSNYLAMMNDSGKTFCHIADYIERNM